MSIELVIASVLVNTFLAQTQAHFKMNSEKGERHIYPQEDQLYYYYNNFWGHSEKESKDSTVSDILNAAGVASTFILHL